MVNVKDPRHCVIQLKYCGIEPNSLTQYVLGLDIVLDYHSEDLIQIAMCVQWCPGSHMQGCDICAETWKVMFFKQ